jgi:2-keto-myo-inositol isomerase
MTTMNTLDTRIGLHTWTLDTTPLGDVLRVARDAGYAAIELRYIDYKRCIESGLTREDYLDLVRASGMKVAVMGVENGIIFSEGEERERLLASLETTCANATALGCDTLMISPGRNPPTTVRQGGENYRRAAEVALRHGLKLALEFNSRHPLLNNTAVAREIGAIAGMPNGGLLLDAYHLHCSGAPGRGFEEVPVEEILAFQFSDAPPGPPSKVWTALDRLPPGTGAVDWSGVFGLLLEKGYGGYVVYEAPNPAQWTRPAAEVAREGITAAREVIAAAQQHRRAPEGGR